MASTSDNKDSAVIIRKQKLTTVKIATHLDASSDSDVVDSVMCLHRVSKLIKQGLTSHQTHYMSFGDEILRVKWPNKKCQRTKGR